MIRSEDVKTFLLATKGKFFSVVFIKRTTGEKRKMLARIMPPTGGSSSYDPDEKNLLFVRDMQKQAWRSIPLENVISIQCGNQKLEANSNVAF